MPRGFSGKSVARFFANTSEAIEAAGRAHSRVPLEGHTSSLIPLPPLPTPRNMTPPFTEEDAWRDSGHARSVGNSSNVVVDPDVYHDVLRRLDTVDYNAGADIYAGCNALDDMCANTFVMPETTARILNVTSQLKNSLRQFQELTAEIGVEMRRYTTAISDIDHGSDRPVAISRSGADQAIQRVSGAIDRQISDMERTAENYKRQSATILRSI